MSPPVALGACAAFVALLLGTAASLGGAARADEGPDKLRNWPKSKDLDGEAVCTYETYAWSVTKKTGVGRHTVTKTRAELMPEESDPSDARCTVCSEDQVAVQVQGLPPVTVCRHHAEAVRAALTAVRESKAFTVQSLVGYRVGRTRGAVVDTLRTAFSNHSYGTAIDINARTNGLYNRCATPAVPQRAGDIAHCKLGVGGRWDPRRNPKVTIAEGGVVHQAFTAFWKWGGARGDKIKDFMHFSITGE